MNGTDLNMLYEYTKIDGVITLINKTIDTAPTTFDISGDENTLTVYARYLNIIGVAL